MGTRSFKTKASQAKRLAVYARVSTEEQTKGLYPSCESQTEELQDYCHSQGWQVVEAIRDEGFSAGSLKRPGLSPASTGATGFYDGFHKPKTPASSKGRRGRLVRL